MSGPGDDANVTVCVLGFDVGAKRIGVAVGNTLLQSARALEVVTAGESGPDWQRIGVLVSEWQPARLIVGEPLTLEGDAQAATRRARAFAHHASQRFGLPVDLVDERSTSKEADRRFADRRARGEVRRRHAQALDAVAAQIIVERWLQQLP